MSAENNNNSPNVNQGANIQDLSDLLILASSAAPLRSLNLLDYLYANSVPLYYGGAGGGAGGGDAVDAVASILARSLYDRCPVKKVITEEAQHDIIDKKFTAAMVEELKINDACGIWQEPFEEGEDIKILPCNHAFKADAILKWLHEEKAECPICRFSLESKEVIENQQNSLHPPSEHQHEDQHSDANAQESDSDIVRVNNIASRLAESVAGNVNPNFHREHQHHHRSISVPMNQLLQSMRIMSSSSRLREPVRAAVPSSGGAAAPVSQSSYASAGHEVRAESVQHGGPRLNNSNAPANNYIYINNYDIINNYNNNYNNYDNNNRDDDDDDDESVDDDENILMMNQEEADIQEAIRRSLE